MSNCLMFALRKWFAHGGYLIIRKSHYGWWPHFLWSPDLRTFESFRPTNPRRRLVPPLVFKGSIMDGDTFQGPHKDIPGD